MTISFELTVYQAVSSAAPISGVSIGRMDDKATWRIDFADGATPEQRAAAQSVLDGFDYQKVLHNADIDAQIETLEAQAGGYNRGSREFMLGMAAILKQCVASAPDISVTPGMVKIKALDDQIKALRARRLT